MRLLENPGRKLRGAVQALFVLGIVVIAIAAILSIAALVVSAMHYGEAIGVQILVVIICAVILFLMLWVSMLFATVYADMSEQLKRQTEILERLEGRRTDVGA